MQPEELLISPKVPVQKVIDPFLEKYNVSLYVKREDLIHPLLSGNKFHKLKYNLLKAREDGFDTLLTFGGAYSNHIYATAAAGKLFGFNTIGIIRGEEHLPINPTLRFAQDCGMKIEYLNRSTYRNKTGKFLTDKFHEKFGKFYLLPEGGSNSLAVKGCSEIIESIDFNYDVLCCACGTGGTLAGLIAGLIGEKSLIGFPVLKSGKFLKDVIENFVREFNNTQYSNWTLITDYHFGGYAKITPELIEFIHDFNSISGILLEPVYTGKMMFGIYDLIRRGFFPSGTVILAIHSGGMQGLTGMKQRYPWIETNSQG